MRVWVILMALVAGPVAAQTVPSWRLVEEWRVGGDVEGAHAFLDPRSLGRLPSGGFAVVDFKDQQVHILGPRGQVVSTGGRRGAGPGEFRNANGLVVLPSGDLVVNDPQNNRLTLLSPRGELRRSVPAQMWGYGFIWDAWLHDGRLYEYVGVRAPGAQAYVQHLRRWSADLRSADTLPSPTCQPVTPRRPEQTTIRFQSDGRSSMSSVPFIRPDGPWAIVPGRGELWMGNGDVNTLLRVAPGSCTPLGSITLPGKRPPVTDAERNAAVAVITEMAKQYASPVPDLGVIPREKPWFDHVLADEGGNAWLLRSDERGQKRREVYGPDGRLRATLAADLPFVLHRPHLITSTHVFGFAADEDDVLHLAAWRIVK